MAIIGHNELSIDINERILAAAVSLQKRPV